VICQQYGCVTTELYSGLSDLIVTAFMVLFADNLQKKLAAARQEEMKQPRVTGKLSK